MPLRSVEAATRDDAIAAAREQFGPGVRVVGVRRVRSGGVLGFFATERYVAEVDPEHPARTAGRDRAAVRSSALQAAEEAVAARRAEVSSAQESARSAAAEVTSRAAADRVNELAGLLGHDLGAAAATALPTYSPATVARPSAAREFLAPEPARSQPAPAEPDRSPRRETERGAASRWEPGRWEPARAETPLRGSESARPEAAFDWSRFEAVRAGLRPSPAEPTSGSLRIRAGAAEPAPAPWSVAASALDAQDADAPDDDAPDDDAPDDAPDTGESLPPSPFTAALARMVAGDRDVRKAVQAALDDRDARDDRVVAPRSENDAEPPRPRSTAPAATPATGAEHQEEEPVEQDDVLTSLRAEVRPAEFPTWAEPTPAPEPASRREEAIAEVLRAALAQGHSDETLTAILRRVLDGASPQAALTAETAAARPAEPEFAIPAPEVSPALESPVLESPVLAEPPVEAAVATAATDELFAADPEPLLPVDLPEPIGRFPGYEPARPAPEPPFWVGAGESLWGEPVVGPHTWGSITPSTGSSEVTADEPIWAEVTLQEPVPAADAPPADVPSADAAFDAPASLEADVAVAGFDEIGPTEAVLDEATVPAAVLDEAVAPEPPAAPEVTPAETIPAEATAVETHAETPAEAFDGVAVPLLATLARTASDPAPLPPDATAVMPPLSLLPPLPSSGRRGGLPPVPPMPTRSLLAPSRPAAGRTAPDARPTHEPALVKTLATVTRLPVAPLDEAVEAAEEEPVTPHLPLAEVAPSAAEWAPLDVPVPVPAASSAQPEPDALSDAPTDALTVAVPENVPVTPAAVPEQRAGLAGRLQALGIPDWLLGPSFAADAAAYGTYAALTRALGSGLPAAPPVPDGPGEVLFVVGPGVETLRAARSLAASLRLDPDRVQWATRGDLAGLAPEYSRMTTIEAAVERRQEAALAGTMTVVAVDAPLRADAYWTEQMLAIWAPEAVWAVVDATRKPEDVEPWIDGLPRVDALMVQDTDLSADPAAVLHRIAMPVALLDGAPATPHRWASLLCERLEKQQG